MQQMAQQMESAMQQQEQESMEEDMEALRAARESSSRCPSMRRTSWPLWRTPKDDPRYVTHGQFQRKLKDDAEMVKDSLFAQQAHHAAPEHREPRNQPRQPAHGQLDGFTDREPASSQPTSSM